MERFQQHWQLAEYEERLQEMAIVFHWQVWYAVERITANDAWGYMRTR